MMTKRPQNKLKIVRKVLGWTILVVALAGAAYAIWRWQSGKGTPEVTYKTAPVERRRIVARVTASGTLQATVTVQVGAQVSGRISALGADFNSTVKKGEIIAKIDPQLFVAAVERENANHAAAKAGLIRAEAQERDAGLVLKRTKALHETGLASAAELQTAETALAVATAQTEVAKATLQQASAALHQAQVNLGYTNIPSPIDGVVISRSVDVGQTVASSFTAPVLFTIAEDLRKMQVHTSVAEGDVGRLQPGMDATFTVDAFPGQRFKGKIGQIRNAAQTVQNVVTYNAVIDVVNDDLKLRPGMTATVTIVFAEKNDVIALPNAALRYRPPTDASASASGGRGPRPSASARGEDRDRTIYVLRGATPEAVTIKTGLSDGTVSEVVTGDLKEGDPVVTEAITKGAPSTAPSPARMGRMF
jgi:HlyD family secretion protein